MNSSKQVSKKDTMRLYLEDLTARSKIDKPNQFVEELNVPTWIAMPILTEWPELLMAPEDASQDTIHLVSVVKVLLQTNAALREHADGVAKAAQGFYSSIKGMQTSALALSNFASFNHDAIEEDEEDIK